MSTSCGGAGARGSCGVVGTPGSPSWVAGLVGELGRLGHMLLCVSMHPSRAHAWSHPYGHLQHSKGPNASCGIALMGLCVRKCSMSFPLVGYMGLPLAHPSMRHWNAGVPGVLTAHVCWAGLMSVYLRAAVGGVTGAVWVVRRGRGVPGASSSSSSESDSVLSSSAVGAFRFGVRPGGACRSRCVGRCAGSLAAFRCC